MNVLLTEPVTFSPSSLSVGKVSSPGSKMEPQVNAGRGLCHLEQQLLLLPGVLSDPLLGAALLLARTGSQGSPELQSSAFPKAQHTFLPSSSNCTWNFCTQKGFWGFSPLALLQKGCGQFFPQIFRVEPISAWGWAGQLLGPPKKLPGPPVLGQAQPPVLREPSQQAEPFPAPWHEQSPRLSLEPRAGHNWGWPLPGCPQLPLVPQAGAWWPCWMEGGHEMK